MEIRGGGGGGRTKSNSVCFTKDWVKIGTFNATSTSKIWKTLSVDQKDQRRRSVQFLFPKSPKGNKYLLNMSTVCLFKKINAQYAFTGKRTKTKTKY